MPRLSDYVSRRGAAGLPAAAPGGQQQQLVPAACSPPHAAAAPAGAAPRTEQQQQPSQPQQEALHRVRERYERQYRRRLADMGPRAYRHPDGSLRPTPPPCHPCSQASRLHWRELVDHCRTHGGDPEYDTHGFSLRYGIGVPLREHVQLMEALGLEPEPQLPADPGPDPLDGDPLADAEHPFQREWRELAGQVFAAAPFQWRGGAAA